MNKRIIIIGGGVSGITTALTLQLLGFETIVYAKHLVNDEAPEDPRFASLYPAASIIPHSIDSDELDLLFPASLQIFEVLKQKQLESLVMHRHFELFEFPADLPTYAKYLHGFAEIDRTDDEIIPRRSCAGKCYGWVFDCFVTEWPAYMHHLYQLYKKSGGTIKQKKVDKNDILSLPGDVVINCSGIWSAELFDDPASQKLIRGHLVHLPDKPPVRDSKNRLCSYNYTPDKSEYATPKGDPSDVYFYPVSGKWILGGSRQRGSLSANGTWQGTEHQETISISGHQVPSEILNLNNDILESSYGVTLGTNTAEMNARVGYRHTRKNDGLRVTSVEAFNKKIIHNYGHGGAGVTISWGCALKVLQLLNKALSINDKKQLASFGHPVLNGLQLQLQRVYWNDFHASKPQN